MRRTIGTIAVRAASPIPPPCSRMAITSPTPTAATALSGTTIDALGGDTLQRLASAAGTYARSRPGDYPTFAAVVELRWARRLVP